ncbi:hypothetical protein [Cellulomonas telluris]|uniref:hypothetical protein n=1 Tax=Cellulomonas telluris TaxID=2306636 RepID=UPI0010A7BE55|nr:hypothetical protein [Cellulomonas telluris]
MTRVLLSTLTAAAPAVGASVAVAAPATAVTAAVGGSVCQTIDHRLASGAASSRNTCTSVRARVGYRDSGGTARYVYGSWAAYSAASFTHGGMLVSRAVDVQLGSSTTGFPTY